MTRDGIKEFTPLLFFGHKKELENLLHHDVYYSSDSQDLGGREGEEKKKRRGTLVTLKYTFAPAAADHNLAPYDFFTSFLSLPCTLSFISSFLPEEKGEEELGNIFGEKIHTRLVN